MVTLENIWSVKQDDYDEIWAIVASPYLYEKNNGKMTGNMKWVPALAPSDELHRMITKVDGQQDFDENYVPRFVKGFAEGFDIKRNGITSRNALNELISKSNNGKHIALVCFCKNENLCHRSIIGGIISEFTDVKTKLDIDYSKYGTILKEEGIVMNEVKDEGTMLADETTFEVEKSGPVIMVTGHRPSKLNSPYDYNINSDAWNKAKDAFKKYVLHENASAVITGMALGMDTVAALAVQELQKEGHDIKLICAIPYFSYGSNWPRESRDRFDMIVEKAQMNPDDLVHYVTTAPEDTDPPLDGITEALMNRNKWMIDHCDKAFAFYDGSKKGGTYNAVLELRACDKECEEFNPYAPEKWVTNHYDDRKSNGRTRKITSTEIMFTDKDNEYKFLTNDAYTPFFYDRIKYNCAEAAFQAQQASSYGRRYEMGTMTAEQAIYQMNHTNITKIENWKGIKDETLKNVMTAKFKQNPKLMNLLMSTEDKNLVFERDGGYIGGSSDRNLAKVLMEIRDENEKNKRLEHTDDSLADVAPESELELEENNDDFMNIPSEEKEFE